MNHKPHTSCNIVISLNSCTLEFDPGIVDRTYMLANYAELDPDCLFTPSFENLEDVNLQNSNEDNAISDINVKVISQEVILKFCQESAWHLLAQTCKVLLYMFIK